MVALMLSWDMEFSMTYVCVCSFFRGFANAKVPRKDGISQEVLEGCVYYGSFLTINPRMRLKSRMFLVMIGMWAPTLLLR